MISDDENVLRGARTPLRLPQPVPEWLSPITAIVPGQLFAMHLANAHELPQWTRRAASKR